MAEAPLSADETSIRKSAFASLVQPKHETHHTDDASIVEQATVEGFALVEHPQDGYSSWSWVQGDDASWPEFADRHLAVIWMQMHLRMQSRRG
jgi:hypothetical protein